ncbi:MAG: amino acid adenylation domain-containing protein, partial [Magnetococcales bacterium]|nr:amino acid adenylation domain-containing protein [Magnetococcales bacterium]
QPARAFLEGSPLRSEGSGDADMRFVADLEDLPATSPAVTLILAAPPPSPTPPAPEMVDPLLPTTPDSTPASVAAAAADVANPSSSMASEDWHWAPDAADVERLLHRAHYLPLIHATGTALLKLPVEVAGRIDRLATPFVPLRGALQQQVGVIWRAVLGDAVGEIGGDDSFFALGGHSLKAVRIVARIQKELGVAIELGAFFAQPTIVGLCRLIAQQTPRAAVIIPPLPPQATYPASHAQLRLWILQQMESQAIAYNTTSIHAFKGALDVAALDWALTTLATRHETLRTTFVWEAGADGAGELHQRIAAHPLTTLLSVDLSDDPDPDARAQALALDDARTAFDLASGPLYRVALLRLAPEHHLLLLTMHHIISDGWSLDLLQQETMTLYAARVAGRAPELPPLPIQYKDYAAWQNGRLRGVEAEQARGYWQRKLGGEHLPLSLPTDFPRPPVQTFDGRVLAHRFTADTTAALHRLASDRQATLFMLLTALVKVLLFRHAGPQGGASAATGREIIIGTPVAGRELPELEGQIGLYLNTLALHDTLHAAEGFDTLLAKVRQTVIEAFAHAFYPFDRLLEELKLERDLSRSPLFDVMVVLQDATPEPPAPAGLIVTGVDVDAQISRFDLVFNFHEQAGRLHLDLTYNTRLFLPARLERLLAQLPVLIQSILAQPDRPIRDLDLLPAAERQRLLVDFNAHRHPWPQQATIVSLFADQVAATPDAIAILDAGAAITYRQLARWSDRIAERLRCLVDLKHEEIVGLRLERCAALYAGILGVMRAGAAALPIDPATPAERVAFMLQDSGCRLLLVEGEGEEEERAAASAEPPPVQRLALRPLRTEETPAPFADARGVAPNDLAYVIYTSGSTGTPKGVLVEHGGFVNMTLAQIRAFAVTPSDRVLQFASPAFDATLSEIFMALLGGAALVPVRRAIIDNPDRLLDRMQATGVTVVTFPPVYLNTLLARTRASGRQELQRLKTLITAGEPPIRDDALALAGQLRYVNAYGPTETSVCATMYRVLPEPERYANGIPIGYPLENLHLYLLDAALQPVPIGVPGEICVAGPGVARGYLRRPELTAERFVANPFPPGGRLYRTGDLGRWRDDGTIELIGRLDDQVKVRGQRVEPEEVAHLLRRHPGVQEAVVIVRKQGSGSALLAFVTPATLSPSVLREGLARSLPGYMVPSRLLALPKLPLTLSGKVDHRALFVIADQAAGHNDAALPPATALEARLIAVWQKVLGRSTIGILDDFFALGGESVKAIQVVAALSDLGVETKDLFLYPTVAALAAAITAGTLRPHPSEQGVITGSVPLTAIQTWFFRDYPVDRHHFNHAEYFFFRERLDPTALHAALAAVQTHHDLLRARFLPSGDGLPRQEIVAIEQCPVDLEVIDLRTVDRASAEATLLTHTRQLQGSLDLARAPLLKTRLLRRADHDQLLVVIHHLIIDAVSWRFLVDDLLRGYEQARSGQAIL